MMTSTTSPCLRRVLIQHY